MAQLKVLDFTKKVVYFIDEENGLIFGVTIAGTSYERKSDKSTITCRVSLVLFEDRKDKASCRVYVHNIPGSINLSFNRKVIIAEVGALVARHINDILNKPNVILP